MTKEKNSISNLNVTSGAGLKFTGERFAGFQSDDLGDLPKNVGKRLNKTFHRVERKKEKKKEVYNRRRRRRTLYA